MLKSQLDMHYEVQKRMHGVGGTANASKRATTAYIDQIPGW